MIKFIMTIFLGIVLTLAMLGTWNFLREIENRLDNLEQRVLKHDTLYRQYKIKI